VTRREFIILFGTAVAWPTGVRAQQARRLAKIGFIGPSAASVDNERVSVFVKRLHELGWTEGQSLTMEVHWANGRSERLAEIAAEFVAVKVDVIVTYAVPAVRAAKQATSVIPIVFAVAADPVSNGLVASLNRPGGNVTGLSNQNIDLIGKRIQLLGEIVPGLRRIGILANIASPNALLELRDVQGAAHAVGMKDVTPEIRRREDITAAFDALKGNADALYVVLDPLVNTNRFRINTLAIGARLPTIHRFREAVQAGGLMSYGANYPDLFRRAAELVDKILRGANPRDLPVEQPTTFDLVINLTTAKALGLTVPPALLARADEVIE